MSSDYEESPSSAPTGVLLRSFMLIAGAYIAYLFMMVCALWLIAAMLFPETNAIMNGEPERFQELLESEPETIFPRTMLWLLLAVNAVFCFLAGWWVSKLAPLGKFQHAIFFAAILFVQYLQFAIGAEDPLQNMLILFMGVSPVAALLGANVHLRRESAATSN